jgi:nitrogen regulatory protein PII
MKMLMAIIDNRRRVELELVLQKAGVTGWTEIPEVHGMGTTGPRLDSAAHPGSSAIIQALIEDRQLEGVVETIRHYCDQCREHIKLLHWDVTMSM